MDEPTTGLDEGAFQRTWRRLLRLRQERGLSILLSTHRPKKQPATALDLSSDGKLIVCDTPSSLQSLVSGDHLSVTVKENPEQAVELLEQELNLTPVINHGVIQITADEAHSLIPRIVELLPSKSVTSINMTRPHLGDVFLHLTGERLAEEQI